MTETKSKADISKAVELIKQFESCSLKAYLDGGGVPTIGYGTTVYPNGVKVRIGHEIDQESADFYIEYHCIEMAEHIRKTIKFPDLLSENQMAAICSWTYNIGNAAEAKSTLIKKLNLLSPLIENPKAWMDVADEFLKWDKDNGKIVKGLTNRRKKERELFLTDK